MVSLTVLKEKSYSHNKEGTLQTAWLYPEKLYHLNQKSQSAASQISHPILNKTTDRGNLEEQAVTDKMGVVVSRSGNAIANPCCKVFHVMDLLRESLCKDKAKDRI